VIRPVPRRCQAILWEAVVPIPTVSCASVSSVLLDASATLANRDSGTYALKTHSDAKVRRHRILYM